MKLEKLAGATSEIWQVFIRDSSSTTGAGLAGLAFNTASLTAYYHRDTDTTATVITLATMTVGTFTSSGFKEIDATNMPGWYQFCPPNAAIASGAKSCGFHLKGATNMAPLPIEVQLVAVNPDDATAYGLSRLDAAVTTRLAPTVAARTLDVSAGGEAGVDWANVGSPTTALALTGTTIAVTQKVDVDTIKTNPVVNAGTVTFPTNATLASTTNITAGTITTTTNLTNLPSIPANWLTAAGIAAAALNGKGDWMVTYTQPAGFLAATFPGTVASTTNITAAALGATERSAIADALLDRDMATGTDSGSTTVRTARQALRAIRNKTTFAAGTLTVTKEDDATASWTAAVSTDAAALPIVGIDPAGP